MITVEKLEKGTYFDDAFKISFRYDPTTIANTNRLNEHDEILKNNSEMIGAIKELATEVKYMRGDLNETVERLNKLEGKDGDKWDKFKWLIVTGLVTLILGYLAVSVGLK